MNKYLKLFRVNHYVKNFIIFLPVVFGGSLFNLPLMILSIAAFVSFCLLSSIVYIINDLIDYEEDKLHPNKMDRPIASGLVTKKKAILLIFLLLSLLVFIQIFYLSVHNLILIFPLFLYLLLNIFYSIHLKKIPIIDIIILASGFIIRLYYGGLVTNIHISGLLALTVLSASFFMALGKRRNELLHYKNSRSVLAFYTADFLDKFMYVSLTLTVVFYALWALEGQPLLLYSVPLVIIFLMTYSSLIEKDSNGNPIDLILKSKALITSFMLLAIYLFIITYWTTILD